MSITPDQLFEESGQPERLTIPPDFERLANISGYSSFGELLGEQRGPLVIAIDGPSNAGKTSLCESLAAYLEQQGQHVHIISLDYFLVDRAARTSIYDSILHGDLTIADYSELAWDHTAYRQVIRDATAIITGVVSDASLLIPDTYDRNTGRRTGQHRLELAPGDIIITEGTGAIAYNADLFDLRIMVDIADIRSLRERVRAREGLKRVENQQPPEYLEWRQDNIDDPHTAYLRQRMLSLIDVKVDTSDIDDIVVYRKKSI